MHVRHSAGVCVDWREYATKLVLYWVLSGIQTYGLTMSGLPPTMAQEQLVRPRWWRGEARRVVEDLMSTF